MNDILSIAADILTVIGASLTMTLEVRRARREARQTRHDDEKQEE
ncbi:hypothetical protein OG730_08040 [Streptomyces sp. NBC_01298]|nr:hypothetical protein OG730_08040 [Streptomyces sp. NBC_01298]